ncbi:histone H1 [Saccharomycopsis crataegensis]|uniref:Histone H1 n=1 Tax=Saccharomycopsis crataegensis TaxID=43959 RepID=A0AAV5QHY9_9ASCO|nr:histone H1 [Saccharomycopsis crataegensis]
MAKAVAAAAKKPEHPTYKDMIKEAITVLKERNGSSRQALKKYLQANYKMTASNFDAQFNLALRRGVDKGDFIQPKGPSGPVKLAKKEPVKKTTEKKVAKVVKPTAPKKTVTPKKATAAKKAVAAPKKAAPKKAAATKKVASSKKAAPKKAAPKKAVSKKAAPKKAKK